eukprot:8330337-Pyramimonas_sp.AAC.1
MAVKPLRPWRPLRPITAEEFDYDPDLFPTYLLPPAAWRERPCPRGGCCWRRGTPPAGDGRLTARRGWGSSS